jgi:hypothetical protein
MANDNCLDDVHVRMLRVTEDLRVIQRELNCAAMQAPSDPELMEALTQLPEIESLELLRSALDQMRHFLWFYVQVMTTDSEGEEPAHRVSAKVANAASSSFIEKYKSMTDAALLRHFADGKTRKPN